MSAGRSRTGSSSPWGAVSREVRWRDMSGVMSRWMSLLVMTRLPAAAVAVLLLAIHRVTDYDAALVVVTVAFTAGSLAAFALLPRLQDASVAWLCDGAAVLALVAASRDWRSPFYVLMLTALILPSTRLPLRRAVAWGAAFTATYLAVAVYTELDARALSSAIRLETIATHLMVPLVVTLALAFAADVLRRLHDERVRSERLAVESERRRIAWELHDSAKQRVHAAHLVLSSLHGDVDGPQAELVDHALAELRAAGAELDTSVAELRMPVQGRPLERLFAERAAELSHATQATIAVSGGVGALPAHVAAHAYRIGAEALTNAVRHAAATRIDVALASSASTATIEVLDDGCGLPSDLRPGSNGLRSMRARAEAIDARLTISPRAHGGTRVTLSIPVETSEQ